MNPAALYELDQEVLAPCGKLRFSPLAITSGRGSRLLDEEGRERIDFSAGGSAAGLGYAHPAVISAVDEGREVHARSRSSSRNPIAMPWIWLCGSLL